MADGKKFVVLISKIGCTAKQTTSQRRVETIMEAKNFDFELVDGANPNQKDRRNELFVISGMRGKYPQIFLQDKEKGHTTFVGDFDTVEGIHDSSSLPDDILDTYPNVRTWSKVLGM